MNDQEKVTDKIEINDESTENNNELDQSSENTTQDKVNIPEESDDKENIYEPEDKEQEKADPYHHEHAPGTVPALFTYLKNTKIPKVLAVSNDCSKLEKFADSLKVEISKEHERVMTLLNNYNENKDFNSVEIFKIFANTYDVKVGISIESAKEIIDKLMEDGNRVAIEPIKSKNENTCAIYYSKDIKSFEEVCEENKEEIPDFFIDNILVL